ncbi:MAG: pentapeptide repeat-containing protein [Candidatus Velthaea sp.]
MRNARFVGTSLRGTSFSKADLDGARFTDVSLERAISRGRAATC